MEVIDTEIKISEITKAMEDKAREIHMKHLGEKGWTLKSVRDLVRSDVLSSIGRIKH